MFDPHHELGVRERLGKSMLVVLIGSLRNPRAGPHGLMSNTTSCTRWALGWPLQLPVEPSRVVDQPQFLGLRLRCVPHDVQPRGWPCETDRDKLTLRNVDRATSTSALDLDQPDVVIRRTDQVDAAGMNQGQT